MIGVAAFHDALRESDLYKQAVERTQAAMQDGTLKGVLWHQGEGDSGSETTAKNYGERLAQMVRDLRAELNADEAPFVAGELGRYLQRESKDGKPSYWPLVNEQINSLPKLVPHTAVASPKDLKHKGDVVHFDSPTLREFGKRYATAMQALQE
jgi:carbohydrate esterase-like sialic acid-specific acetylesterase